VCCNEAALCLIHACVVRRKQKSFLCSVLAVQLRAGETSPFSPVTQLLPPFLCISVDPLISRLPRLRQRYVSVPRWKPRNAAGFTCASLSHKSENGTGEMEISLFISKALNRPAGPCPGMGQWRREHYNRDALVLSRIIILQHNAVVYLSIYSIFT